MTIYEALGEETIRKIVVKFYEGIKKEPIIRPMYPEALAPAEERLFLFLVQVFGGPTTYSEQRGHPMLRRRHFPYPIDVDARNRWLFCMTEALKTVEMNESVRQAVTTYFENAATHLINRE
jgi:hemoglobin